MKYNIKSLAAAVLGLAATASLHAANYTSTVDENGSGTWNDSDWKLNGTGSTTTPTSANTYEFIGAGVGNGGDTQDGNISILRSPKNAAESGNDFGGFSLQMDAGT